MSRRVFYMVVIAGLVLAGVWRTAPTARAEAGKVVAGSGLTWECYDDGSLDPCHPALYGVSLRTANDGWAVGGNGSLLRWDGSRWSKHASPVSQTLKAVSLVSATDGWAVGVGGTILQWDGNQWMAIVSPTSEALNDLAMVSATDGWAVGGAGTILHWTGSQWTAVSSPVSVWLNGVSMVSSSDGWAVGANGVMLHYNGVEWTQASSPTSSYLGDVAMVATADGWASGWNGTMLHWNGSVWSQVSGVYSDIASIHTLSALAADDVYAAGFDNGEDAIYHWDGKSWEVALDNFDGITYMSIGGVASGSPVIAVGSGTMIVQWDGGQWNSINAPYSKPFFAVDMQDAANGWVAGTGFPITHGDFFQIIQGKISQFASGDVLDIGFVPGSNGTDGWAVGTFGASYHWEGNNWIEQTNPPVQIDLNGVVMLSAGEGWAVAGGWDMGSNQYRGALLHYQAGNWSEFTSPTSQRLYGIAMIGQNDGWAVGRTGTLLRWNGTQWSSQTSPTGNHLYAVDLLSTSEGWAAGANGTLLRWNGSQWSEFSSPTSNNLNAIKLLSGVDGWAVGDSGTILHWDGADWKVVPSPTTVSLHDVDAVGPNDIWAVGDGGVIIHTFAPSPSLAINFNSGAIGSTFTLTGTNFPANTPVLLILNGQALGQVSSDSAGVITCQLTTNQASNGSYVVTSPLGSNTAARFMLDPDEPVRPPEGTATSFSVPAGVAYIADVFIPLNLR